MKKAVVLSMTTHTLSLIGTWNFKLFNLRKTKHNSFKFGVPHGTVLGTFHFKRLPDGDCCICMCVLISVLDLFNVLIIASGFRY